MMHQSVLGVFPQPPGMMPLFLRRGMVELHAMAAVELSELGAMPVTEVVPLRVRAGEVQGLHLFLRAMPFLLGPM